MKKIIFWFSLPTVATAFFLTFLTLPTSQPAAHEGATGVVKQRMESMKYMGVAMKNLKAMFTGQKELDTEEVVKLAKVIESIGGDKLVSMFPKGSIQMMSEALPSIWENPDKFRELSDDLAIKAKTLAQEPNQMNFVFLAKSCGACHTDFRKKKN